MSNLHLGRYLHPFDTTGTQHRGGYRPVSQHTEESLMMGRIPRLIAPRTLFGAALIAGRFLIIAGGQAPNFPALSTVELFVRFHHLARVIV